MLTRSTISPAGKELFEAIYRFAEEKNEAGLILLMTAGKCINVNYDGRTPVSLLAKEGKNTAVEFLIEKFHASKAWAVYGAAQGGHLEFVKQLLDEGASKAWAVYGAAQGGHLEFVKQLLDEGASKDNAVGGAAQGGHLEFVKQLLDEGASKDEAVYGAAQG